MAEDVSELVVSMRPEGVEETRQGLDSVEEGTEQATDAMEKQSDAAEGLSDKFQGAMTALVAGLAVASAGLLSQVPVIGEAMSGLGGVVDALAFKIDGALRPSLTGVTNELFDLAEEIYKSDGVLDALDAIVEKIGELGADAIQFSLEGDKLKGATDKILEFVFPSINSEDKILSKIFDVNISGVAVLTVLFGGLAITAAKVLGFVLPASIGAGTLLSFTLPTISASQILVFLLPVIATAAVLSHVFDVNMTKTAILGAIFGGIIITAGAIVGAISWPFIAGATIIGTLFAGVAITTAKVLDALVDENAPAAVEGDNRKLSPDLETGFVDPREVPVLKQSFQAGQAVGDFFDNNSNNNKQRAANFLSDKGISLEIDGRTLGEVTDERQRDRTASRNIDG